VVRAIDIVERALELFGPPVYVRHQIVHNKHVVARLSQQGAVFVDDVDEIPEGAITVFSAHGVSRKVEGEAGARLLDVVDATCPLVRKVHKEGNSYAARGYDVVLVGHEGHAEVEGTRGQISGRLHLVSTEADVESLQVLDPERVAFVTQTTLSLFDTQHVITALRRRFPSIVGPDTRNICYATQNRQKAVLELAREVQCLLVVGSSNSSNATRLMEIGRSAGVASYLIDDASRLDPSWIAEADAIGISAGASTPEFLVQELVAHLANLRPVTVEDQSGHDENVHFRIPDRLSRTPTRAESRLQAGPAE
jgi:4-hydroxy-3-methylbut-2-enyl diphosphate reductase